MEQTIKAILARVNGDAQAAMCYCYDIATQYPDRKKEYFDIMFTISARTESLQKLAAHA